MLVSAVTAGLTASGADVIDLGVMPTPGVSHLVRALGAHAGVVVSASHNPFDDNGLKVFGPDGAKLDDEEEAALELRLEPARVAHPRTGRDLGRVDRYRSDDGHYLRFLLSQAPYLDGMRVGLDCAHGAAYQLGPRVFQQIGARLDVLFAKPDGTNINAAAAAPTPQPCASGCCRPGPRRRHHLRRRRRPRAARRPARPPGHRRPRPGDLRGGPRREGRRRHDHDEPRHRALPRRTRHHGCTASPWATATCWRACGSEGLRLGGEQSGHVLFLDKAPTGDGILTALQVLAACRTSGRPLETWMDEIPVYPQSLVNVRVATDAKGGALRRARGVAAIAEAEADLARRRPRQRAPLGHRAAWCASWSRRPAGDRRSLDHPRGRGGPGGERWDDRSSGGTTRAGGGRGRP
jgi:phosphoglucosamine mutase